MTLRITACGACREREVQTLLVSVQANDAPDWRSGRYRDSLAMSDTLNAVLTSLLSSPACVQKEVDGRHRAGRQFFFRVPDRTRCGHYDPVSSVGLRLPPPAPNPPPWMLGMPMSRFPGKMVSPDSIDFKLLHCVT